MASLKLTLCALLVVCFAGKAICAGPPVKPGKILFYMPLVSKSMKITFMPLAEELASKGHKVTVLMPHDAKEKPNLELIKVDSTFDQLTSDVSKEFLKEGGRTDAPILDLVASALATNDNAFAHPALKKYTSDRSTQFDIVLVSPFIASEAGYYLAHRFNASLALYFTGQASLSFMDWALGQPHNPAYVPLPLFEFLHPMTFKERVINTVATMGFQLLRDWYFITEGEKVLAKHFPGENIPPLLQLEKTASLALHYGHPMIMDGMKPLSPHFQYIGMMNCRPVAESLPKDLAEFMDSGSEHGVIYVSFGSVLQAKEMSESMRKTLINVFGSLKQKVIWKWETEQMPDKPANVKLSKWLPQQDILAHPNTKMFITHAGQSSIQETLCHQKPVVAVPVTGDQPANAREAQRVGFGEAVKYQELTEDSLSSAIGKVLNDPSYTQRAQEHGSLLNDQIVRPLDRAVWSLEFLIRHPESKHMRIPVHDLTWYQYFLLDVMLFLVCAVSLAFYLIFKLCGCLCCRGKASQQDRLAVDAKKKKK